MFENKRLYFRECMRKYPIKGYFYQHKQLGKTGMVKPRRISWPRSGTPCPRAHLIMEAFLIWCLANSRFDLGQVISSLKACFLSCQRKRFIFKKKKQNNLKVLVCKYYKIITPIHGMILKNSRSAYIKMAWTHTVPWAAMLRNLRGISDLVLW